MEFSMQEYWSGVPSPTAPFIIAKTGKQPKCPSTDDWIKKMWGVCVCVCVCVRVRAHASSCLTLCDPVDWSPPGSMEFSRQGIFSTQGWNSHLLHWQVDSLPLCHLVSPTHIYTMCIYYSAVILSVIMCNTTQP